MNLSLSSLSLSLSLSLSPSLPPSLSFLPPNPLHQQSVYSDPRKSDCYQLAVNLLDRYLGYRKPKIEELPVIVCACTMISMKLRRATKECLSYQQLHCYFSGVSEENIRVSTVIIYNLCGVHDINVVIKIV